jgi:hypothetical protein
MKKKTVLIIVMILVILGSLAYLFSKQATPEEKIVVSELQEEVETKKVKISGDQVIIDYAQPLDFGDPAELFGTWAYILGVASQEAPEAKTIIVNCLFEDKQKVKITADRQTVQDFLEEKISTTEFLQLITAEATTQGPEI